MTHESRFPLSNIRLHQILSFCSTIHDYLVMEKTYLTKILVSPRTYRPELQDSYLPPFNSPTKVEMSFSVVTEVPQRGRGRDDTRRLSTSLHPVSGVFRQRFGTRPDIGYDGGRFINCD